MNLSKNILSKDLMLRMPYQKTMIRKMLIICLLLMAQASAWEIQDGMVKNMSEEELLDLRELAQAAGTATATGIFATELYHQRILDFGEFNSYIRDSNLVIRMFNAMLEDHFNRSVCAELKLTEFSL